MTVSTSVSMSGAYDRPVAPTSPDDLGDLSDEQTWVPHCYVEPHLHAALRRTSMRPVRPLSVRPYRHRMARFLHVRSRHRVAKQGYERAGRLAAGTRLLPQSPQQCPAPSLHGRLRCAARQDSDPVSA